MDEDVDWFGVERVPSRARAKAGQWFEVRHPLGSVRGRCLATEVNGGGFTGHLVEVYVPGHEPEDIDADPELLLPPLVLLPQAWSTGVLVPLPELACEPVPVRRYVLVSTELDYDAYGGNPPQTGVQAKGWDSVTTPWGLAEMVDRALREGPIRYEETPAPPSNSVDY